LQQERAFSTQEVAKIFGVSKRTIEREIEKKRIKSFRIGGQVRITESEVNRIMHGDQADKPGQSEQEQE